MKKIVIPALAALIACPAVAGQYQQRNENNTDIWNPYMALRIGAGYTNLNYSLDEKKEMISDQEMHGRVALGLEMCDTARAEVEWSLFTKTKDTKDFNTFNDVEVETKLQTLLFNVYTNLGDYKMIRPFIGAGAGMAFAEVSGDIPTVGKHNQDQNRFSAMGTLGVTFDWNVFAVDMAFRYTYADVNSGLHNFGGDIGIRYMF